MLPGHGPAGGVELYDQMRDYLDFAEDALATVGNAADFKRSLLERFPNHGGIKLVDHQLRFLFR